ncbi:MAG: CHAT domain-containing protein [Blastocatellia bacterium]|nr:CHAT domain-containing protein [Blastocatellia bacterium]
MNLQPDEKLLKWYLLGAASPEETGQIEQSLRDSEAWREELQLIEEDLIDDYARGALPKYERHLFEENYLDSPERQQKLAIAQAVLNYAHKYGLDEAKDSVNLPISTDPEKTQRDKRGKRRNRWAWLVEPAWKHALLAVLILAGIVGWHLLQGELEVRRGLTALNQAYRTARPLEARITGINYAPFSPRRGGQTGQGGQDDAASIAGERAEGILREAVAERPSPAAHHALGRLYLLKKEFDKAINQFEEALRSDSKNSGLESDLGAALLEKASYRPHTDLAESREALMAKSLEYLNKALELDGSLLEARFNRALLYEYMGLPEQAMVDWKMYLEGDPDSQWAEEARRNLKTLEEQKRKVSTNKDDLYQNFLESWRADNEENAWQLLRNSFFRDGSYVANRLIDNYLELSLNGKYAEATEMLQALSYAGSLLERKGDDPFISNLALYIGTVMNSSLSLLSQARNLAREGNKLNQESKNDQAIGAYTKARLLFEQAGDSGEALFMELWIGDSYRLILDFTSSRRAFTQVASVSKKNRYHWLHAAALNGLTNTYESLNEYSKALDSCKSARELSARVADDNGVLLDTLQLATIYRWLGKYDDSLKVIQEALTLSSRISAEPRQTVSLYSIGSWDYKALGLYAAALDYGKEAVRLAKEMKSPLAASHYYVHLGLIYAKLNNYDEAIKNIKYGLEIGKNQQPESIAQEMINYALLYLGQVYRMAGLVDESSAALEQAAEFYADKKIQLYRVLREKLLTRIAQGDVAAAREELPRIIELFEKHRAEILEESNRNSYFDVEQTIYDVAVGFAISQLNDPVQALEYSERSRARSLLDAVKSGGQLIGAKAAPDIKFTGTTEPMPPAEIQRLMPEKAQILEYSILQDKLVIWLISRSKLEGRVVNIGSQELTEKVTPYLKRISSPSDQNPAWTTEMGSDLYDILVHPIEGMLEKGKLLCIVPDKILCLLPFEAVFSRERGKYLLEDYSIIYAASANLFLSSTETARQKSGAQPEALLSVGNPSFDHKLFPDLPDLPAAAEEAIKIGDYYGKYRVYVNEKAVKPVILQGLKDSDVVHLALHYVPNPRSPMLSQIPLATVGSGSNKEDNEVLAAYEIYNLNMARTRLIVLAACQTRVETWFNGEGPVGLSRIFLAAGIPLTISSFWPVEDSKSTTELMINFHKGRKIEGLSTINSLRTAKLKLLKGPEAKYHHPFYWAPFTVTGGYSEF